MRQGVVRPETPRERRERAALEEDFQTISLRGKPLPVRARHFRPAADAYLLATRGPLSVHAAPARDRAAHGRARGGALRAAWRELSRSSAPTEPERFRGSGSRSRGHGPSTRSTTSSSGTTAGIRSSRACRWIRERGDHALVNGRDYRLDAARRELGARALPGRAQSRVGRRARTSVSIASRDSPLTSRRTRSAFSTRGRKARAAMSSGVARSGGSLGPPTPSVRFVRSCPTKRNVPPGCDGGRCPAEDPSPFRSGMCR